MSNLFALQTRRTALLAQLAAVDLKIAASAASESLTIGEQVTFLFGRKTPEVMVGKVVAVQENQVAVQVGDGISTRIVRIFRAAIVANVVQYVLGLDEVVDLPVADAAAANI